MSFLTCDVSTNETPDPDPGPRDPVLRWTAGLDSYVFFLKAW